MKSSIYFETRDGYGEGKCDVGPMLFNKYVSSE